MNRRAALQSLLALGMAPRIGTSRADAPDLTLTRINIPGPHLLPYVFQRASTAPIPTGFDIRSLIDDRWVRGVR